MIKIKKFFLLIFFFGLLAVSTSTTLAQTDPPPTISGDKVVVGQTFILNENQTLTGDLVVIGGTAILKSNAIVEGDVVLIGGVLDVYGTINLDLTALGGSVELKETAVIVGSLVNFGSTVTQREGAVIQGDQIANLPFSFDFEDTPFVEQVPVPNVTVRKAGGVIGTILWSIIQVLAVAALAVLVQLLFPKPTERVSNSLGQQPFVHWGIGLLTVFAAPAAFVIMMITLILFPIGLIGFLVLGFALLYGWIGLGYEIGRRLLKNTTNSLSPALIAGLGTLLLTTITRLAAVVPCVGWTVGAVLALFGLGAVVLTRAGTRNYPPEVEALYHPAPPEPVNQTNLVEPNLTDILANKDSEGLNDEIENKTNSSENKNQQYEE